MEETCSLDIADRGEHTLSEIGKVMSVTREAVRLIEKAGLRELSEFGETHKNLIRE